MIRLGTGVLRAYYLFYGHRICNLKDLGTHELNGSLGAGMTVELGEPGSLLRLGCRTGRLVDRCVV